MEKESDFPDEKKQRIKEDDTSMNEELQDWLKETRDEIKEITRVEKTSKKDEKKPTVTCQICGENKAKSVCLKCDRSVCPSCYFNILGICKKCVPEEYVEKWEKRKPDWEKILGVEWVD